MGVLQAAFLLSLLEEKIPFESTLLPAVLFLESLNGGLGYLSFNLGAGHFPNPTSPFPTNF